jgi:hypothetical protein
MVPLAHVGHWLAELMYVMPVLAVVTWIAVRALLDKRAAARSREPRGDEGREPGAPA